MLAATSNRSIVRFALRAVCLAGFAASAAVATAQDIFVDGGVTESVPGTYPSGTYDTVDVTGASTLNVNAPLTINNALSVGPGTLNVNANITFGQDVIANILPGGVLSLSSGTFSGPGLFLNLIDASFQRTAGRYAVDTLQVSTGSANFVAGDAIVRGLSLLDADFSLASSLTLTGTDVFSDGLYIAGDAGSFTRTNAALITAQVLWVEVDAAFTSVPGDNFTGARVIASFGGSILNTGSQSLAYVEVDGAGAADATFTTTAPVTIDDLDPGTTDLNVFGGGLFTALANVTTDHAYVEIGGLALESGTFAARILEVVGGSVSQEAGASYEVGQIILQGAFMSFGATDSVNDLTLRNLATFTTGTSLAALELEAIDIDGTSILALGSFDGIDGLVSGWGLKVAGNVLGQLQGYVTGGNLVGVNAEELIVSFQDGNTYVTAVPEPSTLALAAAAGLLAGWRTLRRRRVGR